MQSKSMFLVGFIVCAMSVNTFAATTQVTEEVEIIEEDASANAVADYQVEGSLFQQITELEQEKILMQLEKERAQLDLELDRLAAEKIKLHMEIDTLSGRAEQQQQEIETQKAKLEAEAARIEREKESWMADAERKISQQSNSAAGSQPEEAPLVDITKKYRLVNVVGAGSQLQATIEDLDSGQSRRVSVGRDVDGFTVKSISLYDGVVFVDPQGTTQTLNVSNGK